MNHFCPKGVSLMVWLGEAFMRFSRAQFSDWGGAFLQRLNSWIIFFLRLFFLAFLCFSFSVWCCRSSSFSIRLSVDVFLSSFMSSRFCVGLFLTGFCCSVSRLAFSLLQRSLWFSMSCCSLAKAAFISQVSCFCLNKLSSAWFAPFLSSVRFSFSCSAFWWQLDAPCSSWSAHCTEQPPPLLAEPLSYLFCQFSSMLSFCF